MDLIDRLKMFFYDRAPNSILKDHVLFEFGEIDPPSLESALACLEKDGFLIGKNVPNQRYPALQRKSYRIDPNLLVSYPIKTEIEAAGLRVPRMIDGDQGRAEDINSLILAVNKVIDSKAKELEHQIDEQNKKYWNTLITIFGLFVSLFSIINVGVKPALFAEQLALSPSMLVFQSLLNIVPLSVVLLLFLGILNRIMHK